MGETDLGMFPCKIQLRLAKCALILKSPTTSIIACNMMADAGNKIAVTKTCFYNVGLSRHSDNMFVNKSIIKWLPS